eukprot:g2318.t1
MGLGSALWDGAILMSDFLQQERTQRLLPIRGKHVVEVGCGLGLVSATLALLGAARVCATDGDEALLSLTRKNIVRNLEDAGVTYGNGTANSSTSSSSSTGVRVQVEQLLWGDEAAAQRLQQPQPFDLVVAADVVFERDPLQKDNHSTTNGTRLHAAEDAFDKLVETFDHLSGPDTLVVLAYKKRYLRESRFFKLMRTTFGGEPKTVRRRHMHPDFRKSQMYIHYWRKSGFV